MRSAKDIIFEGLAKIREEYPLFYPKYEYHDYSNIHFVQVIPESIDDDENFILLCNSVSDELSNCYPEQGLCFVLEDTLIKKLTSPVAVFPNPIEVPQLVKEKQYSLIDVPDVQYLPEEIYEAPLSGLLCLYSNYTKIAL